MPGGPPPRRAGDARRQLPSVDHLLAEKELRVATIDHGGALVAAVVREVLADARSELGSAHLPGAASGQAPSPAELVQRTLTVIETQVRGTLYPVINATGVIIHTNLGRAPLSAAAVRAMEAVGTGYSNLEYDLEAGGRGSRYLHAERLLCRLTGAEAALAVNNNAGAVFLVLTALAGGREVLISRGQLLEIGGGFRIPDVLRQSGARLVEVGTTNRTHLQDFQGALGPQTALLLRVHSSNFRQIGFTAEVPLADMVALAHKAGIVVVDDLGSGSLLDTTRWGLAPEPMVQQSLAAGADLVTFSGDKLLGGPQAGLIAGREELVNMLRQHPLARVLRVDKSTLAALQATFLHYLRGEAEAEIPVWRMIAAPLEEIAARAELWQVELRMRGCATTLAPAFSAVGGGSLPGEVLPTRAVALTHPRPDRLAAALRAGRPPVLGRIVEDQLLLDPRTVPAGVEDPMFEAIAAAWAAAS